MDWFIAHQGKPVGPLSFDALLRAARRGEVKPQDYIWRPGGDAWERADSITALWAPPPSLLNQVSTLLLAKPRNWVGIGLVGLAIFGAVVAARFVTIDVTDQPSGANWRSSDPPRPIKRNCAFGDYLQGQCR
jgi:hypothetical protein